jgi:hypothetical protein
MNSLDPCIAPFEALAASNVRKAFLAGMHYASTAAPVDGPSTLTEWRDQMLSTYVEPSWKRSVVYLVPSLRFRPSEIYSGRKAELSALHRGTKSLNVGTHNALEALQHDGAIVKIDNGVYAPAYEGVPLPNQSHDPISRFRPSSQFDENDARLVGYILWIWATLKWNVIYITDLFVPGAVIASNSKPHTQVADELKRATEIAMTRAPILLIGRLDALSKQFASLLSRYNDLLFARPTSNDGKNVLVAPSPSQLFWTKDQLLRFAQDLDKANLEASSLYYDAQLRQVASTRIDQNADELQLLALDDPDIRKAAASARLSLERSLSPLIALSGLQPIYGLSPYIEAIGQNNILGIADATEIARFASEISTAAGGDESVDLRSRRSAIEEVWRLTHSPGIIRNAISHRALAHGKVIVEIPRPVPGHYSSLIPILEIDDAIITVASEAPTSWRSNEVMVCLQSAARVDLGAGPTILTAGTRVLGNRSAIHLVPWLVDEAINDPN